MNSDMIHGLVANESYQSVNKLLIVDLFFRYSFDNYSAPMVVDGTQVSLGMCEISLTLDFEMMMWI